MNPAPLDPPKLIEICRQNDVAMIGIFGSAARDEATPYSNLDLLVRFSKRKSLLRMVHLERELSVALDRKVDLVTDASISPYIRPSIFRDLKVLYEAG